MYWICRFACSLLRQDMKQIIITLDTDVVRAAEEQNDKDAVIKVFPSQIRSVIYRNGLIFKLSINIYGSCCFLFRCVKRPF